MTALLSLGPPYVTTYMSGAQNSNSRSQFTKVDRGADIKNGPGQRPCNIKHRNRFHYECRMIWLQDIDLLSILIYY